MINCQSVGLICLVLLFITHPSIAELQGRQPPGLTNHRHSEIIKNLNGLEREGAGQKDEPLDLWTGSGLSANELARLAREKVRKDWHWQEETSDEEKEKLQTKKEKKEKKSGQVKDSKKERSPRETRHSSFQEDQSGEAEEHLEEAIVDDDDQDDDGNQEYKEEIIQKSTKKKPSNASKGKKDQRPTSIQKKQTANKNRKRISASSDSDSDHSETSSLLSILSKLVSLIIYISKSSLSILKYCLKPFQSLLFLLSISLSKFYELTMVYLIRPLVILLSPVYYILSGFYFILIFLPLSFIRAIVKEIYPLYIFFGIAAILGGGLGLGSATVLWFGSLIFRDPVEGEDHDSKQSSKKKIKSKPKRRESVLTKSIREKREMEEKRAKGRRKGFKDLQSKLHNLEDMELNDDEGDENEEDMFSEEGLESDDWVRRRERSMLQRAGEPEEELEDYDEEGYFPNGILKNGKFGKSNQSSHSSNPHFQDSNSLNLNTHHNPSSNHSLPSSHQSGFGPPSHLPIGATSRGGWNHGSASLSNSTTPNGSASSSPLQTPIATKNFYSKGMIGNSNNYHSLSDHLYPPTQSSSRVSGSPMNSPESSRYKSGGSLNTTRRRHLNQSA